ncbi:hypothetical protein KRR38_24040 [Novosphingobium sp. G106]|uniref:hypothetical protein n=1 Tax=Novosphingobium sp. G106 TaxID=2849500 RepID=UPI001C2D5996|nr:hypothetical protein [Novosphingobium sp. G106]MBV1690665.1 hypothetical protein [Novosphingobium sp. G106]
MATTLPKGFEALEPFVDRFAVAGTANRAQLRSDTSPEEREAFHAAAVNLIAPALDLLDRKPLDRLDESEQRLLNLTLSFSHVALAVEIQGPDEERHAELRRYMRITRSPADAVGEAA